MDAVAAGAAEAAIKMSNVLKGQAKSLGNKGLNRLSVMIKELDKHALSTSPTIESPMRTFDHRSPVPCSPKM